jgi:HSP20 family protein
MVKKARYVPVVYISHDETDLNIIIELAGVKKEDIKLEMTSSSVCVNASRKDFDYSGCYSLAHEIDPKKAIAKFENGILNIVIPLTKRFTGEIIPIE